VIEPNPLDIDPPPHGRSASDRGTPLPTSSGPRPPGTSRRTTSSARAMTAANRRSRHAATPDMTGDNAGPGSLWLASRFLSRSAAKVQSDVDLGTKLALAPSTQDSGAGDESAARESRVPATPRASQPAARTLPKAAIGSAWRSSPASSLPDESDGATPDRAAATIVAGICVPGRTAVQGRVEREHPRLRSQERDDGRHQPRSAPHAEEGFDVDSIIRRRGGRPPTRSICWTSIRSASRSAPTGCAVG
jgi:hypothetical protein